MIGTGLGIATASVVNGHYPTTVAVFGCYTVASLGATYLSLRDVQLQVPTTHPAPVIHLASSFSVLLVRASSLSAPVTDPLPPLPHLALSHHRSRSVSRDWTHCSSACS